MHLNWCEKYRKKFCPIILISAPYNKKHKTKSGYDQRQEKWHWIIYKNMRIQAILNINRKGKVYISEK